MTAQLPSKARLADILEYGRGQLISPITDDEIEALARFALAAYEQKPVGTLFVKKTTYSDREIGNHFAFMHADCAMKMSAGQYPLYTHPAPAPAVPDAMPVRESEDGFDIDYMAPSEVYDLGKADGWNACRAAMLNVGKS